MLCVHECFIFSDAATNVKLTSSTVAQTPKFSENKTSVEKVQTSTKSLVAKVTEKPAATKTASKNYLSYVLKLLNSNCSLIVLHDAIFFPLELYIRLFGYFQSSEFN